MLSTVRSRPPTRSTSTSTALSTTVQAHRLVSPVASKRKPCRIQYLYVNGAGHAHYYYDIPKQPYPSPYSNAILRRWYGRSLRLSSTSPECSPPRPPFVSFEFCRVFPGQNQNNKQMTLYISLVNHFLATRTSKPVSDYAAAAVRSQENDCRIDPTCRREA